MSDMVIYELSIIQKIFFKIKIFFCLIEMIDGDEKLY